MRKLRHLFPLAVVVAALALAPAALASDASVSGYSSPAGSVQVNVAGAQEQPSGNVSAPVPAKTVVTSRSSALPFTGLDLGLVVGAGVLLLGLGLGMRRLVQRPTAS